MDWHSAKQLGGTAVVHILFASWTPEGDGPCGFISAARSRYANRATRCAKCGGERARSGSDEALAVAV